MTHKYDIAIVGAGPAGALLARELGKARKKVLLIDGSQTRPKVCGGLLSPDAQKVFAELDLTLPKHVLDDPQIFDVETVDLQTGIKKNYPRHYLNMNRDAFDRHMLSLVGECVDVVSGFCLSVSKCADEFVIKIRKILSDGTTEVSDFNSKLLVGADGASSIVRRTFFADRKMRYYVAIQQHFEATSHLSAYLCAFDKKTSDSCSWSIRKENETIYGGAFKINSCKKSFDEQKKRLEGLFGIDLGAPQKTEACLLSCPKSPRSIVLGKNGVFLIGEAAGFISASSFEGISYALRSAKLLSSALISCEESNKVLRHYKRATLSLRLKVCLRIIKKHILCSPLFRKMIMKSGIGSINKNKKI